jgi:molybdopterin-guanine dinucleotide biosynthesis adapter protein
MRGFRVGTIKHHAHPGFDIDYPGKDSWRHGQAGSDHVIIVAPDMLAEIIKLERPLHPDEVLAEMGDVDIVLTDGYRKAGYPKIETLRAEISKNPVCEITDLLAVASDFEIDLQIPHFDLDDPESILEFVLTSLELNAGAGRRWRALDHE